MGAKHSSPCLSYFEPGQEVAVPTNLLPTPWPNYTCNYEKNVAPLKNGNDWTKDRLEENHHPTKTPKQNHCYILWSPVPAEANILVGIQPQLIVCADGEALENEYVDASKAKDDFFHFVDKCGYPDGRLGGVVRLSETKTDDGRCKRDSYKLTEKPHMWLLMRMNNVKI